MVSQVPLARETVTWNSTFAAFIDAKEGLVAMSMQSVGLTFMTEQASSGGEAGAFTRFSLAAIWLQV